VGASKSKFRWTLDSIEHAHTGAWVWDLVRPWVAPVIPVAAAVVVAVLRHLDVSYLIPLGAVTFGGIMLGGERFSAWRRERDSAYGLAYVSCVLGYEPRNEKAALQLGVSLENVSYGPIRYVVERFHVVVSNRTITAPQFLNTGGIIARNTTRYYKYPPFPRGDIAEFLGKNTTGRVEFSIKYGHPDRLPDRRLQMALDVSLRLDDTPGCADGIVQESDERARGLRW
jgi:hypothetical protein